MNRKQILGLMVFLVVLALVDRGIGAVLRRLFAETRPYGSCASRVLAGVANRDVDVMFFGSSRTRWHLDPAIFEAHSGHSAFNLGCDGANIFTHCMAEALFLSRDPSARLFLLILDPKDLYLDPARQRPLLTPLVSDPALSPFIAEMSPLTRFKLLSWSYQFNSLALRILAATVDGSTPDRGEFTSLQGSMAGKARPESNPGGIPSSLSSDQPILKRQEKNYLEFAKAAKSRGIEVVWINAPRLRFGVPRREIELRAAARLEELAALANVPILQLTEREYPLFADPGLFKDHSHLNGEGARLFTIEVARQLEEKGLVGDVAERGSDRDTASSGRH